MERFICRYPFDTKKYGTDIRKPKGAYAHGNFPESRYAKDFRLPLETPVMAAKKGTIFLAKHDSDICFAPEQLDEVIESERMILAFKSLNLVCIEHENGTFTEYCHLSKRKVVSNYQLVGESELVGYTGRSGVMDLDHLHFNAFERCNGGVRSISMRFVQ